MSGAARLACLDGLRGWAAVMVVLSHLWGQFARHVASFYDHPLLRLISDGHLAVLIFFVLSGVTLSLRFVQTAQPVSLLRLVIARYVRLVIPILVTTLIVYLLIALRLSGSAAAAHAAHSEIFLGARPGQAGTLADALSFSLYSVLFDYDPPSSYNTSLWSMSVEFKGSLLIFGLMFLFSHLRAIAHAHRLAMVGALSIVLMLLSEPIGACFTTGYMLAELAHAPSALSKGVGLAALALAGASFGIAARTGRQDDSSGTLLAIGMVTAALFWPLGKRFLSLPVSTWLGRISFPLYLIHVPLIGAAGPLYLIVRRHNISLHLMLILVFAGCLLAARLLLPVERLSMRLSRVAGQLQLRRRRALPAPGDEQ